uniref:Uncharacterized protein n=1 Tax=Arundo donax TaxID=35708 RepID=A0A0A9DRU2_ARUDO
MTSNNSDRITICPAILQCQISMFQLLRANLAMIAK